MQAAEVIRELKALGTQKTIDGMARYGIPSTGAFGVPMGTIKALGKRLGRDHALAKALWKSGVYEARCLAAFVGEPEKATAAEMNAWVADFDSWAVCDTICFNYWDKSPFAWSKAKQWASSRKEFVKRTGFVLMACLAGHDREADDKDFLAFLPLIEKGAGDERNFVKKGVSWALRGIGRRSSALKAACRALATRLAASGEDAARWVGRDALRDLGGAPKGRSIRSRRTS